MAKKNFFLPKILWSSLKFSVNCNLNFQVILLFSQLDIFTIIKMEAPIVVWFGLKFLSFNSQCVSKFVKGERIELIKNLILCNIDEGQRIVKIYGCGSADMNNNMNSRQN